MKLRVMRVLFVVAAVVAVLGPAPQMLADECARPVRIVMTYWGWYGQYGPICGDIVISPQPDPSTKQMIGQFVYKCDGGYEYWGETECGDVTVDEYDCTDC